MENKSRGYCQNLKEDIENKMQDMKIASKRIEKSTTEFDQGHPKVLQRNEKMISEARNFLDVSSDKICELRAQVTQKEADKDSTILQPNLSNSNSNLAANNSGERIFDELNFEMIEMINKLDEANKFNEEFSNFF